MVKLTTEMIVRGTSSHTKKKRDEPKDQFLRRVTHLYLENKGLEEVGDDLCSCRNLSVLYLYDNKLTEVPNLISNGNLTHLYLQNNQIRRIQNFQGLGRLQKLYLGGNSITVIENLEKLECLQELYVENQHLSPGEKLILDPRSLAAVSSTLQVLNISNNGMDTLSKVFILSSLQHLVASDNELADFKELAKVLPMMRRLTRLDLMGNPICHKPKYRDRIILLCQNLDTLDGKEVTDLARRFILNWQASKDSIKQHRLLSRENTSQNMPPDNLGALSGGSAPPQKQMAATEVPAYIMPAMPKRQMHEVNRSVSHPNSAFNRRNLPNDYFSKSAICRPAFITARVSISSDPPRAMVRISRRATSKTALNKYSILKPIQDAHQPLTLSSGDGPPSDFPSYSFDPSKTIPIDYQQTKNTSSFPLTDSSSFLELQVQSLPVPNNARRVVSEYEE